MPALRRDGEDLLIDVVVQVRASRTEFVGLLADRVKVRLHAPPVDGKAIAELLRYCAAICAVGVSCVRLERGAHDRRKTLRITRLLHVPAVLRACGSPT